MTLLSGSRESVAGTGDGLSIITAASTAIIGNIENDFFAFFAKKSLRQERMMTKLTVPELKAINTVLRILEASLRDSERELLRLKTVHSDLCRQQRSAQAGTIQ